MDLKTTSKSWESSIPVMRKAIERDGCSSSSIRRASPNQTSISAQKDGSTSHLKAGNRIGISNSRCRKIGSTPRSSLRNRCRLSPILLLPHIPKYEKVSEDKVKV